MPFMHVCKVPCEQTSASLWCFVLETQNLCLCFLTMALASVMGNHQPKNSTASNSSSHLRRRSTRCGRSREGNSRSGSMGRIVEEDEKKEEYSFGFSHSTRDSLHSHDMEEKVFVAVGQVVKESISTLTWALRNCRGLKKLVLLHVHRPSQWIPLMGGKFLASQLENQQVTVYRQEEKKKMDDTLEEYESFCKSLEVQVEKLVIEMDDVARGLVELIVQNDITQLIMGAAADRHYSKKLKVLKSKKACIVQKEAPTSCKIWFVCKDKLICTRKLVANSDGYEAMVSPKGSCSSSSSLLSDSCLSPSACQLLDGSQNSEERHRYSQIEVEPSCMTRTSSSECRQNADKFDGNALEETTEPQDLEGALRLNSSLTDEHCEDGSTVAQQPRVDDFHYSSTQEQPEALTLNDLCHQLEQAIGEAADLKDEAYAESCRRRKAEKALLDAIRKRVALETKYAKEMEHQKEVQEAFEKAKLEIERLINQRDAAQSLLNSLKIERDQLQCERDNATREVKALQQMKGEGNSSGCSSSNFSQFTSLELEQATQKFNSSLVIGQGGYGCVYKGYIRHTPVAIKILHPESLQGQSEFYQEVEILSKVRHPNLVTLVGACSESRGLVYEFLPNGSLEDHLTCKNGIQPLPWHIRTRISYEVCCALVFLHLAKPSTIVHGDLKPANILLDANLVSKLGDFGISRLITPSATTTLYHHTVPKGTPAYLDPEFLSTGDLTPQSDVYSFGVVLSRLLTGKPALGIVKEVREAVRKGKLQDVLDPKAGDWPMEHAQQLAHLASRCCDVNRKNRPDLMSEVWRLEKMKDALLSLCSSSSSGLSEDNKTGVPPYFICPISQEIMKDPCVAADGYTYESVAIGKWLESGNKTSPKTNLTLSHDLLTPNHFLRAAIQGWLQQRQA